MLVALGLLAAVAYGSADFAGGLAARRAPAVTVVLWSQLVGVAVLVVALAVVDAGGVRGADLGWGAAAGILGGTGMALLYAGLAAGVVSVVSPVTAVTAALVPVAGSLALGEPVSALAAVGMVLGVGAVALLSFAPGTPVPRHAPEQVRRAVLAALGAGSAFGGFFLLIDRTQAEAGLWPLLSARATSIPLMVVAVLVLRRGFAVEGATTRRLVIAAGAVDMTANISFLLATRKGSVGVVAVLVALAPAATLALARLVLHERVRRSQAVGLAVGATAVVLIALG